MLSVFALGLCSTPDCLLPLIIKKLVHAGVGVTKQLVHGYHFTLALAYIAVQCEGRNGISNLL